MGARPRLVAFEGPDGSGKSSLLQATYEALEDLGVPCAPTRLRCWLDPWAARTVIDGRHRRRAVPADALVDAEVADHALQQRAFVVPALAWWTVLQDRSAFSVAVYLDVLHGVPAGAVLDRMAAAGVRFPDLVVLLETAADEAWRRTVARGAVARYWETPATLRRVADGFDAVLSERGTPWAAPVLRVPTAPGRDAGEVARDAVVPAVLAAAGAPG